MKTKSIWLVAEAVFLGGPTTVLAAYGAPTLFIGGLLTTTEKPIMGLVGLCALVGSVWALSEFWRLAFATVAGSVHFFGLRFWLGIVGAYVGAASLYESTPPSFIPLLVGPISCVALHFSYVQWHMRSTVQLGVQPGGPASGGPASGGSAG